MLQHFVLWIVNTMRQLALLSLVLHFIGTHNVHALLVQCTECEADCKSMLNSSVLESC